MVVLPVATPKAGHIVQQRSHRANVGDVAREITGQAVLEIVNKGVTAALDEVQHLVSRHFLEVAYTAFAVNTPFLVQHHKLRKVVVLFGVPTVKLEAGLAVAVLESAVLQLTRAAFIAGGAVQRVIDEGKFHHARLGLFDLFGLRDNGHPVCGHQGTRRHRFGHPEYFGQTCGLVQNEGSIRVFTRGSSLHQTHPAGPNRG